MVNFGVRVSKLLGSNYNPNPYHNLTLTGPNYNHKYILT